MNIAALDDQDQIPPHHGHARAEAAGEVIIPAIVPAIM
jgi:hypothetical protein